MHLLFYFTHYISIKYGNQNNSTVWRSLRTADGSIRNSKVACPKAFSRIDNSSNKLLKKFKRWGRSHFFTFTPTDCICFSASFPPGHSEAAFHFSHSFLLPWFWLSIRSLHWIIIYDPKLDCQFLVTLSINIDTDWWSGNHFETSILSLWVSRT